MTHERQWCCVPESHLGPLLFSHQDCPLSEESYGNEIRNACAHMHTYTHSQLKSSSNYLLGLYSLLEFQINIIWLFKLLITEWVSNNTKYLKKKRLQIFFYLMCLSHVPDPNVPLKLRVLTGDIHQNGVGTRVK